MADTPAPVRATFPWRAVLDVSTGYLSPETHRVLEGWTAESAPLLFGHTYYGWFIWCPDPEAWDEGHHAEVPADLREVLTWARAQGAEYVLFDADGCDEHAGLTWREAEPQQDSQAKPPPAPPTFDPALVTITRHRQSVTQQEVTIHYDGRLIWFHAGDDMHLRPDGEYRGHDDAYWIEATRKHLAA